jgi:hypothetical protein
VAKPKVARVPSAITFDFPDCYRVTLDKQENGNTMAAIQQLENILYVKAAADGVKLLRDIADLLEDRLRGAV